MTQLFCEKDQRFLADRYVEGVCPRCGYDDARGDQCDKCGQIYDAVELISPRCKLCNSPPVQRDSKHMFLRIDTLQPKTEEWARKASKEGEWSANSKQITESWFKEGLRPFSLTRDLKWGVPVPLEEMKDKVLYVWFDAPIGYPSITAAYTEEWEKWWKNPDQVTLYQFMGKDNVRFHTVIFPSCLIGTGDNWTKLHHISTTEYLQYEGGKFSKSRGVGVFGDKAAETGIASSVWRYYLLMNRPETSDSQFAWGDFIAKNNNELLANLGNFVNRVLTFISKKYDGVLPDAPKALLEAPNGKYAALVSDVNALLVTYCEGMEQAKLRSGLQNMMAISARGNLFLSDAGMDNKLFANQREACDATVFLAANLIYLLTALIHPFMPTTSDEILAQLDAPPRALPTPGQWKADEGLIGGHKPGKPKHLFKRIEETMEETWRRQFAGDQSSTSGEAAAEPAISKRQAAKLAKQARKAAEGQSNGPSTSAAAEKPAAINKTPEMLELEKKVEEQGKAVRVAKEASKKPDAGEESKAAADAEVQTLLQLK